MAMNKILRKSVLALALAGSVGTAQAGWSLTSWSEDLLNLSASWHLDGAAGSYTTSYDGIYWDITSLDGTLDYGISTPYASFVVDLSAIGAQHAVAPHAGEPAPGPAFSGSLAASAGSSSTFTAMAPHTTGAVWTTPANWTNPHWDHYSFTLTSNTDGTADVLLTAIHPVPEPETYAMLLAGLGLMGTIVRRREADRG